MNNFINIKNIRTDDQAKIMKEIENQKHCPFCIENLNKYHKRPIIKDGKYWILTENQWPYDKIKHQLLAIYKKHIEHLKDIDPMAGKELFEMFSTETISRDMPGGGIAIRFGSNSNIGSYGNTVNHLHAHLIEPDLQALDDNESWKFKFGQKNNKEY